VAFEALTREPTDIDEVHVAVGVSSSNSLGIRKVIYIVTNGDGAVGSANSIPLVGGE